MNVPNRASRRGGRGAVFGFALLALLLAAARTAPAQSQGQGSGKVPLTVSGEADLWLPIFDGVMRAGTETDPGTEIRLDTHIDLESHPEVYDFGVALGDVRYGKLAASFLRFSAPGNKVLCKDLSYAGALFHEHDTVHSEFNVSLDRVTVSYIQDVRGAYILTYEVGMAFFRWKASLENRHTGNKGSEDATVTLPLTGLHVIFPLGDVLQLMGGFTGVFFRTSDDDVSAVDAYLEIRLSLASYLLMGVGYRHFNFDGELDLEGDSEGNLEFTLGGVYLTLGLKI